MKLCVFPNDPLKAYFEKGEIKERYYNPNNMFSEIHVLTFDEFDINEEKVKLLAGNAKLIIHCVGKINLKNKNKFKRKILDLVSSINPAVIRAYNTRLEGWIAAFCAEKLEIPFLLSIHTQNDQKRRLMKKKNFKKFLILKFMEKTIEPHIIKKANKIIIIYKIIEPYVIKHGGKNIEVLYNNVNLKKFESGKLIKNLSRPLVLSVGNLTEEKNHQCIIKAMKNIEGNLLIIGNGPKKSELIDLIHSLKIEDKVSIIERVPYEEIQNYYKSADVFALAYDTGLEGVPKPVIEAMASGLPVVVPYPKESYSEGLEGIVVFAKNEPNDFREKIGQILSDDKLHKKLSERSLEKSKEFDALKLESRESEIYVELIRLNNKRS